MRILLDDTIARIRTELPRGGGSCTAGFVEEVVRQVAYPLGGPPSLEREDVERNAAADVLAMVRAAFSGGAARAMAASRLADDAMMLAIFFQNLDLLGDCARGHGGAVAALVAAALEESTGG